MLTSFEVTCDTNLLGQIEVSAINSDALTSAHKVHVHVVFQLHVHVHHSLSCVPLRQYTACVIDSLGLGITRVLYHCTMCIRHPNLSALLFMPSLYSTF